LDKTVKHKLDLRGVIIPFTLLKVSQVFKILKPGETLEVIWSDPEIPQDLFKVLPENTYDLISIEEVGKDDSYCRIRLCKKEKIKTV